MNVSTATLSGSLANSKATGSSSNSEATQLEKQKQALQKQIQTVNQGQDDDTTKQQKIDALNLQVQALDAQILQLKADQPNQANSGTAQKTDRPSGPPPGPPPGEPPASSGETAFISGSVGTRLDLKL